MGVQLGSLKLRDEGCLRTRCEEEYLDQKGKSNWRLEETEK
jgi:hypothetical protein